MKKAMPILRTGIMTSKIETSKSDITWTIFDGPGPKWKRLIAQFDGQIFFPVGVIGNENAQVLCASFDGVRAIMCRKHAYLPLDWVAREHPEMVPVQALLTQRLSEDKAI
jgi:hypothetical protein